MKRYIMGEELYTCPGCGVPLNVNLPGLVPDTRNVAPFWCPPCSGGGDTFVRGKVGQAPIHLGLIWRVAERAHEIGQRGGRGGQVVIRCELCPEPATKQIAWRRSRPGGTWVKSEPMCDRHAEAYTEDAIGRRGADAHVELPL